MQKVQLAKLTIRAPIGGVITKRNIQEGQLVSAATPTFNIVDPESFMLVINPPEKELPRLKLGQAAEVTVDALGDQVFEVKVRRINPNVDPASGTVKVTLDFDKAIQSQLRESAFARVRLVLETHENALLIAKDTLVEENARKYVFVVKPAHKDDASAKEGAPKEAAPKADVEPEAAAPESAKPEADAAKPDPGAPAEEQEKPQFVSERVEVQVGLEDSKAAEILSGIEDSSLVVTLGQHTLKTGSFVTITNANDELLKKAGLSTDEALKAAKTDRTGQKRGSFEGHRGPHPQH
jgi:multidrug efflux pump subunit AcrA (membrane-fusion protein)